MPYSTTIKIAPKDLGKWEKKLADRLAKTVGYAQLSCARQSISILQDRTRRAPPASENGGIGAVDKGTFLNSWQVRSRGLTVMIINGAAHALFVEEGRRPGRQPPVSALIGWVQRKLGVAPTEAKGVAFLVARAIGRRGLFGRFITLSVLAKIDRLRRLAIQRAFKTAFKEASK